MNKGKLPPEEDKNPEIAGRDERPERIDDIMHEAGPPGFLIRHTPKIIGGLAATLAIGGTLFVAQSCESEREDKPVANPAATTQPRYGLSVEELTNTHRDALRITNIPRPKIDVLLDKPNYLQTLRLNTYEVHCDNGRAQRISAFILQGGNTQPQSSYAQFALSKERIQKLEPFRTNKINNYFSQRTVPSKNDPEERAVRSYISQDTCGNTGAELQLTASHELIGGESFGSHDEGGSRDFQWYLKIFAIANGILLLGAAAGKKGGAFRNVSTSILKGELALVKGSARAAGRVVGRGMTSASEAMKHRSEHPSQMSVEEAEEEFLRGNPEFRQKDQPF